MSDHWNSLANLLGTPSLSPQSKRGADAAPKKTPEPKQSDIKQPAAHESKLAPTTDVSTTATKEPSRLRSSWDAVASFFGIQSTSSIDSKSDSEPVKVAPSGKNSSVEIEFEPNQEAHLRGSKKGRKPSLWDESDASKESVERPVAESTPKDFSITSNEPIVSFGNRRRNRNEPKSEDIRDDSRERRHGRIDSVTDEEPDTPVSSPRGQRGERSSRPVAPTSLAESEDGLDAGGPIERRAPRHAPRRGRSDDLDTIVDVEVAETSSAPPRESRSRQDHPRRDRSDRTSLGSDRPERGRPSRDSISDESVVEPRGEARKQDRRDRSSDSMEAGDRPARRSPRPSRSPRAEEVGFGAGLKDPEDNESSVDGDSYIPADDSRDTERNDEESRRGRNQRKSRKSAGRSKPSVDDSARMEADESEKKFVKIPSWVEALDGILQSNMENHQRISHGRDRHKGRPPRSSDR